MNKSKKSFFILAIVANVIFVILGRLSAYFYTLTATDISYSEAVYVLFSYLSEITVNARVVFGFVSVSFALYKFGKPTMYSAAAISFVAGLADYLARFVIDYVMNAITDMIALSAVWLLLNFLYESVFLALAVIIAILMHSKCSAAETSIQRRKYSDTRAVYASVALVLISKIVAELIYLSDFLSTYTDITGAEISSIVGQFLQIIIIYGGVSILLCELFFIIVEKTLVKSE